MIIFPKGNGLKPGDYAEVKIFEVTSASLKGKLI
jgi:hypothetical protein